MKKLINVFISMPFMAIMLIVYVIAMGYATLVDNNLGNAVARHFIYDAWWFHLIQLILAIIFIGNIYKYKLYKKAKWSICLLHLALIVILIGAAITHYFGYEGIMHIREGESENKFISEKQYLIIKHSNNIDSLIFKDELFISPAIKNEYKTSFNFENKKYDFELLRLIPNAIRALQPGENGIPMMEITFKSEFGVHSYYVGNKSQINFQGKIISLNYNPEKDSSILFSNEGNKLFLNAPFKLEKTNLKGETDTIYPSTQNIQVRLSQWYSIGEIRFMINSFYDKAKITYIQGNPEDGDNQTILECNLKSKDQAKDVFLPYLSGQPGEEVSVKIDNNEFQVSFGCIEMELPFSIKLRDFLLERYPGSESPSSFASEVTLFDSLAKVNKEFRIFMNNILRYKGYRFYQSWHDNDELGTILSVSHDRTGTSVTYFGYLLLLLGIVWTMLNKNSYFAQLRRKARELKKKHHGVGTKLLILFFIAMPQIMLAQDEQMGIIKIDKTHADHFGNILVQDNLGRIKPLNTLNSELLRKISRKGSINGLNHNQVVMGMMFNPQYWQKIPLIKISHPELMKIIGTTQKLVSFEQVFNQTTSKYRLKKYVINAFNKKPGLRSKFDKDIIAVDERVNLVSEIFSGQILKIFPFPGEIQHKWLMPSESKEIKDSVANKFVSNVFTNYYYALVEAEKANNWKIPDQIADSLINFQKEHAKDIIPSDLKIKLENHYTNTEIFNLIFKLYGIIGFIFLIILLIGIVNPGYKIKWICLIISILLGLLFLFHTYGLGLRWYISGHAPWSNGYESMIYISWATMLAGFLFMKRSPIVLAATSILASITLMVAHLSWMDPQITNLVPVLKSYWLTIHVSVITASYGFLALAAILGLLNLVIMIMKNSGNRQNLDLIIDELTIINQKTMIIGLYLLTIGTFLGAVWANESWGRYWGWDPKETWALISVIIYALISHTRLIPSLNNNYAFNLFSLLGFSSILMTYFGVNYYLSGLHSYGQGYPAPVSGFVYYALAIVLIIAIIAFFRNKATDSKSTLCP